MYAVSPSSACSAHACRTSMPSADASGASLKRSTKSCPSMCAPRFDSPKCPALPTTAHDPPSGGGLHRKGEGRTRQRGRGEKGRGQWNLRVQMQQEASRMQTKLISGHPPAGGDPNPVSHANLTVIGPKASPQRLKQSKYSNSLVCVSPRGGILRLKCIHLYLVCGWMN